MTSCFWPDVHVGSATPFDLIDRAIPASNPPWVLLIFIILISTKYRYCWQNTDKNWTVVPCLCTFLPVLFYNCHVPMIMHHAALFILPCCHCSREDKALKGSLPKLLKHTHYLLRQTALKKMTKQSPFPSYRKRMAMMPDRQKIQGRIKLQKMLVLLQMINCQESWHLWHRQIHRTVTAHVIKDNILKVCPLHLNIIISMMFIKQLWFMYTVLLLHNMNLMQLQSTFEVSLLQIQLGVLLSTPCYCKLLLFLSYFF